MPTVAYQYEPEPKQALAHATVVDELLYGGAAGGGKSRAGRAHAMRMALMVPGSLTYIFRRTFPQLQQDVIPKLRQEMPPGIATYNKSEHTWYFRNGSRIVLGHMQNEDDVDNYLSSEPQLIIFEELTQFTENQYRMVRGRLRAAGEVLDRMNELGWISHSFSTTNPGGIGHVWVKARFFDPGIRFKVWLPEPSEDELDPVPRMFVPAKLEDNPHMDPGYARRLDNLEPVMRRAMRDGDWDILKGVRFTQFRRSVHVIEPEELPVEPVGRPIAVGVDYGNDAPFAALWGALYPDNLVVIYRELYKTGLTPQQQAEAIAAVEAPDERAEFRPIPIALDPSTWARAATDPAAKATGSSAPRGSIAWYYQQQFPGAVVKARNDRIAGWALVDEQLRVRADGLPRLLIYSTCTNLIRTLPAQMRAKINPEDVDTHGEDHAADALRYLLMQLVRGGSDRTPPDPFTKQPAAITAGLATASF